ncbi:uncharacterized protein LOC143209065 [Lasioglossum baleicum]|uniref:uncharacterized protein LOC143209065 n=1 Tax=Lasioglossum baleicum TaxID=434251 RepID=UPI003FCE2EEF
MIATMRGACLAGVLVIIIGCLAETQAYVSFDQVNPGNSSVSDDDLLKSAVPEQEAKAETEKPKLTRVPLEPRKSRRSIDGSLATINENDGEKPSRVAIKERPAPGDIAPEARPGAKRNHKKMKLAQTQSQKKSKKTKRYIDTAAQQQLSGHQNHSETVRGYRHKDEKYHAQRKAIMDKFHARNREILRKYQQTSTTTTTTTTEGPIRYNLGFSRESLRTETGIDWFAKEATTKSPIATPPPQVLARTNPPTRSILPVVEEKRSARDENDIIAGSKSNTTTPRAQPKTTNIQEVGNCKNLESLNKVYQHNLVLDIQRSTIVETEISSPTVEGSCVDCVIAYQISGPSLDMNVSKTSKTAKIRAKGVENGSITIVVKFYTNPSKGGHC